MAQIFFIVSINVSNFKKGLSADAQEIISLLWLTVGKGICPLSTTLTLPVFLCTRLLLLSDHNKVFKIAKYQVSTLDLSIDALEIISLLWCSCGPHCDQRYALMVSLHDQLATVGGHFILSTGRAGQWNQFSTAWDGWSCLTDKEERAKNQKQKRTSCFIGMVKKKE